MSVHKIINPSNGKVIAEVPIAGEREVEAALAAARKAFDSGPWPRLSLAERKGVLLKVSQGILDKAAELAKLESENAGKPIKESTFMDIPSAAKTFEYFANNLENFLVPETVDLPAAESKARLVPEPRGVVVLIVPWNYPLLIASWKTACALAAGNTVILKPSSLTPLTALELSKIAEKAGLPEGVFTVINGPGSSVGESLCSDKRVDMVSFTGSNEVGKQIAGYAAANAKKLTMELGGKSGAVVFKDCDLELAVNGSLCSIFLNQGQMCTAMSRIFVEDGIYNAFISDFTAKAKKIKLGDSLDYQTQMGPLASDTQRKKVIAYVEKAKARGAKLLCGGKIPVDPALKDGFFFEPTVFTDVPQDSELFREEVFGPVACVNRFSTQDEALRMVNSTDFGLACSLWTKNQALAEAAAQKIDAGIVWANTYGMFYNELPYGGFKRSGFGKELGRQGFLEYTRLKNIVIDGTKNGKPLVNYWYGF